MLGGCVHTSVIITLFTYSSNLIACIPFDFFCARVCKLSPLLVETEYSVHMLLYCTKFCFYSFVVFSLSLSLSVSWPQTKASFRMSFDADESIYSIKKIPRSLITNVNNEFKQQLSFCHSEYFQPSYSKPRFFNGLFFNFLPRIFRVFSFIYIPKCSVISWTHLFLRPTVTWESY